MAIYTVDRIIEGIAILLLRENETVEKEVPINKLPKEVKEGDLLDLEFKNDGVILQVTVLENETEQAKKKADALLQKILAKNKSNL